MKRTFVLLIALQVVAAGFHANAQVNETRTETSTTTQRNGNRVSTQTETSTYAGGVYTYTNSDTRLTDVFFGIRLDANMSGFLLKDLAGTENRMRPGGSLGGFMRIETPGGFAMQSEIIVHFKTSTIKDKSAGKELDYEYWGVEIPFYYMGRIKFGQGKGFIGAGPYVGFGIDAQYVAGDGGKTNLYEKEEATGNAPMQRWDFGFGAQLTYEFRFGLQITAGYKIGVIDALDAGKKDASMLPHTASLGLGFRF